MHTISIKNSAGEQIFKLLNLIFMLILITIMLYPILNVLAVSFSSYTEFTKNPLMIIPKGANLDAYRTIFSSKLLKTAFGNSIFITIVGTSISIFMTIITGYPLSKRALKGRRQIMFLIVFTMLFSGGIIPSYLLVRNLGLLNKLWALILPVSINSYYLIIMISAFRNVPVSLEESAKIEGANDIYILFKIIVPMVVPTVATLILFYGVANWNQYFSAVVYIISRDKWTLQLVLKEIVLNATEIMSNEDVVLSGTVVYPHTIKCAAIAVISFPILILYPSVQKYFIKGVTLGAVKG